MTFQRPPPWFKMQLAEQTSSRPKVPPPLFAKIKPNSQMSMPLGGEIGGEIVQRVGGCVLDAYLLT